MWDRDRDLHDTSTHWPVEKGWTETRSVENKSAITSATELAMAMAVLTTDLTTSADAKIGGQDRKITDLISDEPVRPPCRVGPPDPTTRRMASFAAEEQAPLQICGTDLPFGEPGVVIISCSVGDQAIYTACDRLAVAIKATHDRRPLKIPSQRWLHDAELHATPGLGESGACSRMPIMLEVVEVGGDHSGGGTGGGGRNRRTASLVLDACGMEGTTATGGVEESVLCSEAGNLKVSGVRYNPKLAVEGSDECWTWSESREG